MKKYKILKFNEMGDRDGKLVVLEALKNIPFEIKRIFYIYGTKSDVIRGEHANKNSEFVLINVVGKCKIMVDDGLTREIIDLDKPNKGIYLNKMVWKDMYDFSKDSVLLVISSMNYDSEEYIRDYELFKKLVNS